MSRRITVAGDGAWGRALTHVAAKAGHSVAHWSRKAPEFASLRDCEAVIVAVPAQAVREVMARIDAHLPPGTPAAPCSMRVSIDCGGWWM
mgnify:CR=1 FL=1